jgi:hypothetical protein
MPYYWIPADILLHGTILMCDLHGGIEARHHSSGGLPLNSFAWMMDFMPSHVCIKDLHNGQHTVTSQCMNLLQCVVEQTPRKNTGSKTRYRSFACSIVVSNECVRVVLSVGVLCQQSACTAAS